MSDRPIKVKVSVEVELDDICTEDGPLSEFAKLEEQDIIDFIRERYEIPGLTIFERLDVSVHLEDAA